MHFTNILLNCLILSNFKCFLSQDLNIKTQDSHSEQSLCPREIPEGHCPEPMQCFYDEHCCCEECNFLTVADCINNFGEDRQFMWNVHTKSVIECECNEEIKPVAERTDEDQPVYGDFDDNMTADHAYEDQQLYTPPVYEDDKPFDQYYSEIICQDDVKQCEDGTYVTRNPYNDCLFDNCKILNACNEAVVLLVKDMYPCIHTREDCVNSVEFCPCMNKYYEFQRTLDCIFPAAKDICYERMCLSKNVTTIGCFDGCGMRLNDSYQDDCNIYEQIIGSNIKECIRKCDETILFPMQSCEEDVKDCLNDCVIDPQNDDEDDCSYMERVAKNNNIDCILDCNEDITNKLLNRVEKCNVTMDMEDIASFEKFGYFGSGSRINTVVPFLIFLFAKLFS
jgi:hypothetical protein